MDRGEFLSILRESLAGYIPSQEIEENISFYRNYFDESQGSDREIIEELGDPRLIARTIIEAYKASKGPMADYYMEQARNEYSQSHSEDYEEYSGQEGQTGGFSYQTGSRLLGKVAVVLLLFFVVMFAIGMVAVAIRIFLYLLPILLVLLLVKYIWDLFQR